MSGLGRGAQSKGRRGERREGLVLAIGPDDMLRTGRNLKWQRERETERQRERERESERAQGSAVVLSSDIMVQLHSYVGVIPAFLV